MRNRFENPRGLDSRAWYAVQDRLFDRFAAQIPGCRVRLREMVAADGGPELDGSVRSLEPLGEWAVDWVRREPEDGEDWLPYFHHAAYEQRSRALAGSKHGHGAWNERFPTPQKWSGWNNG
ncbi:MAG: hypothetical protein LBC97_10555 [Bifidobacteriaceae bacterium]|nr:hypothetical protein [Bifidobacteriaceae bacterium]